MVTHINRMVKLVPFPNMDVKRGPLRRIVFRRLFCKTCGIKIKQVYAKIHFSMDRMNGEKYIFQVFFSLIGV